MTNKEKKEWLSVKYPLTIICDRYDGTYSGAKWLAFPLDYDKIPSDVDASDPEYAQFWKYYKEPVGRGVYASDAVADLIQQMREFEPEESEEDEHRRKDAIYFLESAKRHYADTSEIEKAIDWLKSLRPQPHWKPSDEQMEAMEYVIRDYREDSCNATANYLQEILDHLKNM